MHRTVPKVFNLQILLELSEILVMIGYPPPWSTYNNNILWKRKDSKRESEKMSVSPWPSWVLWTPDTFTSDALKLPFTVLRNNISDTDFNSLNQILDDRKLSQAWIVKEFNFIRRFFSQKTSFCVGAYKNSLEYFPLVLFH